MDRGQLEHVVRAAADVVEEEDIVVVGSQAILGAWPDAPGSLLRSIEADVFPKNATGKAIEIDGSLGDGSPFHETFGYFAHGIGPETVVAPAGWEERLVIIEVQPRSRSSVKPRAHCLEPHDLVLATCVADRDRDWEFARDAVTEGVVDKEVLLERVDDLPIADSDRERIRRYLRAM
jgi:hypothetical protein